LSEVLSQEEIDALLSALTAGELNVEEAKHEEKKRKIKVYDFRRPDKLSKDQLRIIQMIYESFARALSNVFSVQLRVVAHVEVISVGQFTYGEFMRSISNPTVLAVFSMSPLQGNGVMEVNSNLSLTIIDRLFGGSGFHTEKNRELTDIEQSVIGRIFDRMMENLKEAWSSVVDLNLKVDSIETNPNFVQISPPNDMVITTTLKTKIGDFESAINFCIPYLVLEPIISKLNAKVWFSNIGKETNKQNYEVLKKRMERTFVPISVELGTTELTVENILDLQCGDVIPLNTKTSDNLKIYVGSRLKFFGFPGTVGGKIAIQITGKVKEEEEEEFE
jgi:flagellar motor switch protein FliM